MSPFLRMSIIALAGFVFIGCGAKEHHVITAPTRALSEFPSVEVKPFSVSDSVSGALDEKKKKDLQMLTDMIGPQVAELLAERKVEASAHGDARLVVEGTIVGYKPGNQALRYMVGFGAGSSRIIAEVHFKDAQGNDVGSAEFVGGVTSGVFGGTKSEAVPRIADEIADFVSGELSEKSQK